MADDKQDNNTAVTGLGIDDTERVGRFVGTNYQSLVDFAQGGHCEVLPIIITEAEGPVMIRGSHGVYRLGLAPQGEELLLFSECPDTMKPMALENQEFAGGYWLNLENVDHIHVPEARAKRTTYNWEIAAVQEHTSTRMLDLTEYAYLNRVTDSLWVSGAIAYRVMPVDVESLGKRRQKKLEKSHPDVDFSQPLFVVHCYTTKGRGHNFTEFDEDFLNKTWGRLLTWSARSGIVSKEEAEKMIADDFLKRQELVRRGDDPDDLGPPLRKKEPHMQSQLSPMENHFAMHYMRTVFTRSVQEFYVAYQGLRGSSVLKTIGMATAFALMQLTRGIIPAAVKAVTVMFNPLLKPFINALKREQNVDFRRENIAARFTECDENTPLKTNGVISQDIAPFIRLLDYHEVDIRPEQGAEVREELRDDWAAHKLVDAIGGPPGTMFMKRELEGKEVLYARQPDGIEAYYLIGKKVAYIRYREDFAHPMSAPLADAVKQLFHEHGPYVRVFAVEGEHGHMQEVGVKGYDSRKEQRRAMRDEIASTYTPMSLQSLDFDGEALCEAFSKCQSRDREIAAESLTRKTYRSVFNFAAGLVGAGSYKIAAPENRMKEDLQAIVTARNHLIEEQSCSASYKP